MEEIINTWIANGCVGLTTVITILLIVLRTLKTFKSDKALMKSIIENALVQLTDDSEKQRVENEKTISNLMAINNSQQKQIEELTRNMDRVSRKLDSYMKNKKE